MNKQITFAALMAVLMSFVCPMRGWAQKVTIDDVKYSLYDDNHAEVIRNKSSISGDLVIPALVSYEGTEYAVTSIGGDAFSGCRGLTSIEIPASVTSIGDRAFRSCSGLTSVVIPSSVTSIGDAAFSMCSGLTSVVIPSSVTSIGDAAFSMCSGLTSVVIPSSVMSIGKYVFEYCSGLTSIDIPSSVTSIGDAAFMECSSLTSVMIPASVMNIEGNPFPACSSLTAIEVSSDNMNYVSVDGVLYTKDKSELCAFPNGKKVTSFVIPASVTSIGNGVFGGCSSLTSVVIPEGVTSIGGGAFSGCSGLTSIVIPEGVTSIGSGAFSGCSSLTSVVIPEGVTSIGSGAFMDCSNLISVVIPEGVTSIKEHAFEGCSGLTSVVLPTGVLGIGIYAFSGCSSLTSIVIPDSVGYIQESAFQSCSSLTSIVIPDSVWHINKYAFDNCSSLMAIEVSPGNMNYISVDGVLYTKDKSELCVLPAGKNVISFVIPESVTSIGDAFSNCRSLKTIYCKAVTPPSASYYLDVSPDAVVYVPIGSKAAYEAATGWKDLTIKESDFTDVTSSTIALPFVAYATSDGLVLSSVEGEVEVAVYNLQGVALYRGTVSVGETVVALPSGNYVVRACGGQGTLVIVP